MAYEMVMPYHLHMSSYFLETFTEYPWLLTTNHFIIIFYVLPLLSPCGADQMQR